MGENLGLVQVLAMFRSMTCVIPQGYTATKAKNSLSIYPLLAVKDVSTSNSESSSGIKALSVARGKISKLISE